MPRKLTTDEFCVKLKKRNPLIEITSEYIDSNTKVQCLCTVCGNKWQSLPKTLLAGHGCAKCHYANISLTKRTSQVDFVEKVAAINSNVEIVGKYEGVNKKIECKCKKCGTTWFPTPYTLYKGHGCPTCAGYKRRDTESFIEEMAIINPNISIVGKFSGVEKKIECKCNLCGDVFFGNPVVLLNGGGCALCAGNKKKTTKTFAEELRVVNPNIEVIGEYINLYTKIECKCKVCGDLWNAIPKNLLNGHGCASCADNKKKDTKSFAEELAELNSNIEVLGEYLNNKTPIRCKCLICGNEWSVRPSYLLRGQGCPECYHSSTSFMEMYIYETFKYVMGEENVIHRDKKLIGQELDIVIPQYKVAIEPGSFYWHKNKLKADEHKQLLSQKAGYRLIVIYDSCQNAKQIYRDDVWMYEKDLGRDASGIDIQGVANRLLKEIGVPNDINEDTWKQIAETAYKGSRRKTTEQFIEEVKLINSEIEVLGEYTKSNARIRCKCKICNNVWNPNSESILMGHGCPKCAFAANGKRSSRKVVCVTTGQVFESITEAAIFCKGHISAISRCCLGKQRTSAGYEWKYYEE